MPQTPDKKTRKAAVHMAYTTFDGEDFLSGDDMLKVLMHFDACMAAGADKVLVGPAREKMDLFRWYLVELTARNNDGKTDTVEQPV